MEEKDKIIIELEDSELEEQKQKKDSYRVLTFLLGEENYCVDIKDAKEVTKLRNITKVPNTPQFIIGVMNLRGEILPLIDIRLFLSLPVKEISEDTRTIVTDFKANLIGILVDKVKEVEEIELEAVQPPLATIENKIAQFTKGEIKFKDVIMTILDLDKILHCEELERLKKEG